MKWRTIVLVGKESALKARRCQSMVSGASAIGGKNMLQTRFGAKNSVRCSEFRGARFSEVANVLPVWDF